MQNLTVQKVIIALITLGFFVASPFLIAEFLDGNTLPVFLIFGIGILLLFVFWLKDRCWLVIPFCLPVEGRFNFLPLNFSMLEIAILYVMSYMLLQFVMGRQPRLKTGSWIIWVGLGPLLSIVLYHWIRSGDIGIRALGGTGWGGRTYFQISLYALAIPVIASFSGSSLRDFRLVPLVYLLGTLMDLIPNTLTTLVPGLAPYIFKVYSAVNTGAYGRELMGAFTGEFEGTIIRFRNFGFFGYALALAILSYIPFRYWLSPNRLWVAPALLLSLFLTALSGFRSQIFYICVGGFVALWATARRKAFLLFPIGVIALGLITVSQGTVLEYPLGIQRAFSFLPGNWNQRALADAEQSSLWRKEMRELFFGEYFKKAPWIGQGYHYDPIYSLREFDLFMRITVLQVSDTYSQVRPFIERRQPHEGDIHLLLSTGIIGMGLFILFCLSVCFSSLRDIARSPVSDISPVQIWGTAILVQQTISFFAVYGDLAPTIGTMGPVAAILFAYRSLVASATHEASLSSEELPGALSQVIRSV